MSHLDLETLMAASPIAPIADPYSVYAQLPREAPVKQVQFPARPTFFVSRIAHAIIDRFAAREGADLVAEFTYLYPLRVFTELLGLDPADVAMFYDWAVDLSHEVADPARGVEASVHMREYLGHVLREKKRRPDGGMIGRLATAEVNGERISDEEVIGFVCLLVIAGAETTYHLMGSALYGLLCDADLHARVRTDRQLIPQVLDETLRWESPVQRVTREAIADAELAGTLIPAGSDGVVGIGSANRDERRFPNPERFSRFAAPITFRSASESGGVVARRRVVCAV